MTHKTRITLLAVIGCISIGIGVWAGLQGGGKTVAGYPDLGGDFSLTSDAGPFNLADQRGKVVPIYFGFTHYPDVCITSLSAMASGLKQLTDSEREQIQPVFITVDPERDDAAKVGEYARYFYPDFVGLSGTLDEITQVAKEHFVVFEKVPMEDSDMGYTMDHSSIIYVVGKDGVIKSLIHHGESPEEIARVLRQALSA